MVADVEISARSWSLERTPITRRQVAVAEIVRAGLRARPRSLPPILFYDRRGSELFEEICGLDEYYVTRTERRILEERSSQIATACAPEVTVVELGSGSSEKSSIVLELLRHASRDVRYVPIDISESAVTAAAERLTGDFPGLELRGLISDYDDGLRLFGRHARGQCLVTFLGGNLGNLEPMDRVGFMRQARETAGPGALFLLGVDRVKSRGLLERAYDDRRGVTAAFNLNLLTRINRELGADFDLSAFAHRAIWDAEAQRIEMHLESLRDQRVDVRALGESFHFAAGERIHTESSYKFTDADIEALAAASGWRLVDHWQDAAALFSLVLFRAPRQPVAVGEVG